MRFAALLVIALVIALIVAGCLGCPDRLTCTPDSGCYVPPPGSGPIGTVGSLDATPRR